MSAGPQDNDPPDVRLVLRAGIAITGAVLRAGAVDDDDLERLAAFRRAMVRLRDHLNGVT